MFSFFSFNSGTATKISSGEVLVDLHGKVVIVTGANTGIGYATVEILARQGAKIYLAGRDEKKITAAIAQLRKDNTSIPAENLHPLILDLSDPRSVKRAAEGFMQKETRLDVLVNNAAINAHKHTLREDGVADVMMVNHIGHFALTQTLLPVLKATAKEDGSDVRIVNLTSIGHMKVSPTSFVGRENFSHIGNGQMGSNLDAYGYTKLANILHILHLQNYLNTTFKIPITCMSVHPGTVKTTGSEKFIASTPYVLRWILSPMFGPWQDGAVNVAFAAAAREVRDNKAKYRAAYLTPVAKVGTPSKAARDERLARELWETTVDILKEFGV